MRILFDECVPWPLDKVLPSHDCRTAQQMLWKRIKNGELLSLAELHFDLFLTCDQNLRYQQKLTGREIATLELSTNKMRRLQAAAQLIREMLASSSWQSFSGWRFPEERMARTEINEFLKIASAVHNSPGNYLWSSYDA